MEVIARWCQRHPIAVVMMGAGILRPFPAVGTVLISFGVCLLLEKGKK